MTEHERPRISLEKNKPLAKARDVFTARRGYVVVRNPEYVRAVASGDMESMRAHAPIFDARFNSSSDGSSEDTGK